MRNAAASQDATRGALHAQLMLEPMTGATMHEERKGDEDYGDDQGTRQGAPTPRRDATEGAERDRQADGDETAPRRTPRAGSTGAGSEAIEGGRAAGGGHDREHRSGYGGSGGEPVESSDNRQDLKKEK
jgi:hypothetical protein